MRAASLCKWPTAHLVRMVTSVASLSSLRAALSLSQAGLQRLLRGAPGAPVCREEPEGSTTCAWPPRTLSSSAQGGGHCTVSLSPGRKSTGQQVPLACPCGCIATAISTGLSVFSSCPALNKDSLLCPHKDSHTWLCRTLMRPTSHLYPDLQLGFLGCSVTPILLYFSVP